MALNPNISGPQKSEYSIVTTVIRLLAVIFDISLPEQRALHRRKVALETTSIPVIRPAAD